MMLGFPKKKVIKALKNTDNNPDRAAEWLFSHDGEPDSDHEMTVENVATYQDSPGTAGVYRLGAFITHLGKGVHSGHYVAHVRKDGQWVYFNDAKVAQMQDPPIGKGYLYFLRRDDMPM
mmetsp:Transcript_9111/g.6867  ORF Transcript_9111/g.6867 Transcript_9111/m.6867 type:complete len:119 (-) Transcript_9111:33-389(-)